jgi:hypothetical protein
MSRNTMGLVALLGAALLAGCSDDDDDDSLPALSGPQQGSITIDLATNGVTFPTQPQGAKLGGTAVYDDPTDTITLSLSITNKTSTLLQNPKVVPTNLSEGTITGDGTFGPLPGDGGPPPYIYYGPEAMLPNTVVTRDITIDGVTGVNPEVTLDVEVLLHPYFVVCSDYDQVTVLDSSGTGQSADVNAEAVGFFGSPPPPPNGGTSGGDTRLQPFVSSADGRYVYFSCWNQPAVAKLDLSNLSVAMSGSLVALPLKFDATGPVGSIDALTLSPDGKYIYATLNDGCHSIRSPQTYPAPSVQVVKLNAANLAKIDSVEVFPATVIPPVADGAITYLEYRGRRVSISDDGTTGAMAVTDLGTVYLLNLSNMTVTDVDGVTAGTQGFDVSGTAITVRHAAISGDGSTIYVAYNDSSDGTLDVIDVATGGITTEAPTTVSAGDSQPGFLEFGPDGRLYYGRNYDGAVPGLSIFDPVGDAWVEVTDVANANAIEFGETSYCVSDQSDGTIQCFAYADDSTVPAEASGLDTISAPIDFGHGLVLTDI